MDNKPTNLENEEGSENIITTPEVTPEVTPKVEEGEDIKISKEDFELLEKAKKKELDFEKAFKIEKDKRKKLEEEKAPVETIDKDALKGELLKEIKEEQFFNSNKVIDAEDRKILKESAQILGISLEDALKNELVQSKLKDQAQERANKASEESIEVNSVFFDGSYLTDTEFNKKYKEGALPKTEENRERYIKSNGLAL